MNRIEVETVNYMIHVNVNFILENSMQESWQIHYSLKLHNGGSELHSVILLTL